LPAKVNDIIEYDELWSFVISKLNRVWLWIALCRRTKQVVAYHLGDRDYSSFCEFYQKVPIDYANCLSRSDGLKAYKILTSYGHKMCKRKNGETSQVEAFNTVLRQRLARLVRKTCAFSKSFDNHEMIIRLFIQSYNENIKSVAL
jgi:insertion element IS1 protein InsB